MIGTNKCLSVKVCLLLTWLQSSWKPFQADIRDGSEKKKSVLGGSESFTGTYIMVFQVGIGYLGGTVFSGGTLYPSANYEILNFFKVKHNPFLTLHKFSVRYFAW